MTTLLENYIAAIPTLNLDGDELEEYSTCSPAAPEPGGNRRTQRVDRERVPRISATVQVAGCLSEAENCLLPSRR
jgi:hypothetical protein